MNLACFMLQALSCKHFAESRQAKSLQVKILFTLAWCMLWRTVENGLAERRQVKSSALEINLALACLMLGVSRDDTGPKGCVLRTLSHLRSQAKSAYLLRLEAQNLSLASNSLADTKIILGEGKDRTLTSSDLPLDTANISSLPRPPDNQVCISSPKLFQLSISCYL